jgi:hypothetical protein
MLCFAELATVEPLQLEELSLLVAPLLSLVLLPSAELLLPVVP